MPSSTWRESVFKMPRTSHPQMLLGAAAVLVLATGIAAVLMFFRVTEASRWVAHTLEVRAASSDFFSQMQAAETGQRGYLLTRDERYLEPYENAVQQIEPALSKLRALTLDNPAQQLLLAKITPLVASRFELLRQNVSFTRDGQEARALDLIKQGSGKRLMDDIGA